MKIIFLDIDGVLNTEESGYGGFFQEHEPISKNNVRWDENCVKLLQKLVKYTNAIVVISSTWRLSFSLEKFQEMFDLYNAKDVRVLDKTPDLTLLGINYGNNFPSRRLSANRGDEVEKWIEDFDGTIESFVIFDDDDDFRLGLPLIQTEFGTGLTEEHIKNAQEILMNKPL